MGCTLCSPDNQLEFSAEINIHFSRIANADHPGVLTFPKILICLDCGISRFTIPGHELRALREGSAGSTAA